MKLGRHASGVRAGGDAQENKVPKHYQISKSLHRRSQPAKSGGFICHLQADARGLAASLRHFTAFDEDHQLAGHVHLTFSFFGESTPASEYWPLMQVTLVFRRTALKSGI